MNRRDFIKLCAAYGAGHTIAFGFDGLQMGLSSGVLGSPHFRPRARRIIYLYMAGGPSQFETFYNKPQMAKWAGKNIPREVLGDQRLTGMSGFQSSLPVAASPYSFSEYGNCGMEVSELLPYTAGIVDDICLVNTMYSEAINHGPANTFMQTGSQLAGRPSIGAWLRYGLGSDNPNLPPFVVMRTKDKKGQPLFARLWGNGFLPAEYQGVMFMPENDPVLFLNNPGGMKNSARRSMLDRLRDLEQITQQQVFDPNIDSRLVQYEMAYRMQSSLPEAVSMETETDETFSLYGPDSRTAGTFANNCILARRMAERGVKFIQLYHQGWDQHSNCPGGVKTQCREVDQASAALITDLKRRGMLDDTLVIWGGEFGRTAYSQGKLTADDYGRDHHPACFPIWMAGGGVKGGMVYGTTDDFGTNIIGNEKMHVHDFHATVLHLMGIDHERLTYRHQGRDFRLTDVHGHVNYDILTQPS